MDVRTIVYCKFESDNRRKATITVFGMQQELEEAILSKTLSIIKAGLVKREEPIDAIFLVMTPEETPWYYVCTTRKEYKFSKQGLFILLPNKGK